MVKIRKADFLTDCYRDIALALQAILEAVYSVPPWRFDQTFSDMLRENTVYYLAFSENQEIVGFLAISIVMAEVELTNLAVRPDFQGQGVASSLLKRLSEFEADIFLEVRASNLSAQKLYKKFGFEAYHERKAYYQTPKENAILMKRENKWPDIS
jgi:ribosomal-protein-alanine N-acetyltransferase